MGAILSQTTTVTDSFCQSRWSLLSKMSDVENQGYYYYVGLLSSKVERIYSIKYDINTA